MGKLADYNINEVAGALSLAIGSLGGLCLILFKSRCKTISICYGLWKCNREVLDEDETKDKKDKDKKDKEKDIENVINQSPNQSIQSIQTAQPDEPINLGRP